MENKYKSMGTILREMAAARNSEARKRVVNVGRPDTPAPTDSGSKLAKQAEIKVKIIDEDYKAELPNIVKSIKAKKSAADMRREHGSHYKKLANATSDEHGTSYTRQHLLATAQKHMNEAVELDEVSKEKLAAYSAKASDTSKAKEEGPRKSYNRLRGLGMSFAKRNPDQALVKPKVTATEEVELDEASVSAIDKDDIQPNKRDVDPPASREKKKKDSGMDEMEPGTIKGGKTEVDLNPKTNDDTDNQSKETSDSNKARKAANKEVGAKGVKEETMTNKNFGLPEGLMQTVNEVLKGGQKKLDKNHNGKLDAQDFKLLRGKKDMKEEACPKCGMDPCKCTHKEEVELEAYDPARNTRDDRPTKRKSYYDPKTNTRVYTDPKTKAFQKHAVKDKVKEEVELDEVSKATLGSYVKKATDSWHGHDSDYGYASRGGVEDKKEAKKAMSAASAGMKKRSAGIKMANKKLAKEEVEQIDELTGVKNSPLKKLSYTVKASKQIAQAEPTKMANDKDAMRKFKNRMTGVARVAKEETNLEEGTYDNEPNEKTHKKFWMPGRGYAWVKKQDKDDKKKEVKKEVAKEEVELDEVGDTPAGQEKIKKSFDRAIKPRLGDRIVYGDHWARDPKTALNALKRIDQKDEKFKKKYPNVNHAIMKKEEVEFSAEELARLEAIAKELN